MQLQPGTLLHGSSYDYRIECTLGQGSFGITYKATVTLKGALGAIGTQVAVAVKEFFMRDLNSRSGTTVTSTAGSALYAHYRHDFQREAHNLSRLSNAHIVKVVETFEANNTVYFVMELIDGGSLDSYIRQRGRLSEREALEGIVQVAEAVQCMHQAQMLHLDIKPMNVMRRGDGTLVLIDFGLSKQFSPDGQPETSTSIGGGTLGYAPLEQASYKKKDGFTPTLDIYALGATLYKMLAGTVPPDASVVFNDGFPFGALLQAGVSKTVAQFVERAMEPMRRKRPQNMEAFIAEARALLPAAATAVKASVVASANVGGVGTQTGDGTAFDEAILRKVATMPSSLRRSNLIDNHGKPRQIEIVTSEPTCGAFGTNEKPVSFEVHWASYVSEEAKRQIRLLLQGARHMETLRFNGDNLRQYCDSCTAYGLDFDNEHNLFRFSQQLDEYGLRRVCYANDSTIDKERIANKHLLLYEVLSMLNNLERFTALPFRLMPAKFLHIDWSAAPAYWEQLKVAGFDIRTGLTISTFGKDNHGCREYKPGDMVLHEQVDFKLVLAGTKPLYTSTGFCLRSTQPLCDEVQPLGFGFYRARHGERWEVVTPSDPFGSLLDIPFDYVSEFEEQFIYKPTSSELENIYRDVLGVWSRGGGTEYFWSYYNGCFNLEDEMEYDEDDAMDVDAE